MWDLPERRCRGRYGTPTNRSSVIHPVHLHDIDWQVVDVNRQPPGPVYQRWKDTFQVAPMATVRVIGRFDD